MGWWSSPFTPPTVSQFTARFVRDFPYTSNGTDGVLSADIQNALNDAAPLFNPGLWSSTTESLTAYLFLTAHLLVLNLQMAGGLSARPLGKGVNNVGGGVVEGTSIGGISANYAIPERIRNSPILSQFMRTDYGQRYLYMLTPRIVGPVSVAAGFRDWDVEVPFDINQT
jgi:hypothetical protein